MVFGIVLSTGNMKLLNLLDHTLVEWVKKTTKPHNAKTDIHIYNSSHNRISDSKHEKHEVEL